MVLLAQITVSHNGNESGNFTALTKHVKPWKLLTVKVYGINPGKGSKLPQTIPFYSIHLRIPLKNGGKMNEMNEMDEIGYKQFIDKYPHNLSIDGKRFERLLKIVYHLNPGLATFTPDQVIEKALHNFGGTITDSLIDMIYYMENL